MPELTCFTSIKLRRREKARAVLNRLGLSRSSFAGIEGSRVHPHIPKSPLYGLSECEAGCVDRAAHDGSVRSFDLPGRDRYHILTEQESVHARSPDLGTTGPDDAHQCPRR